jgi:hypothetical protein
MRGGLLASLLGMRLNALRGQQWGVRQSDGPLVLPLRWGRRQERCVEIVSKIRMLRHCHCSVCGQLGNGGSEVAIDVETG